MRLEEECQIKFLIKRQLLLPPTPTILHFRQTEETVLSRWVV